MTSIIKVDNLQNQCGANIISESANVITIGASGDTVTLAAGASQSGFGRTGTVNWDTTPKTTTPITGVSGNGYFINTTSGAITVNLPAGVAGSIVAVSDYANTAATNNITINPNGTDKINGGNFTYKISTNGAAVTLIYVDATRGWKDINDATLDVTGANPFVLATGGTIATCGDYKIHTFTGPGTFTVTCAGTPAGSTTVDYLVVAGGASGGSRLAPANANGGGGAGGFRYSNSTFPVSGAPGAPLASATGLPVTATSFPITVGAGGASFASIPTFQQGNDGTPSIFSTITSAGGGGGGGGCSSPGAAPGLGKGRNGGSGGGSGGGGPGSPPFGPGGTGNSPPTSPSQGNNGGNGGGPAPDSAAGGGGGAIASGTNASPSANGPGGIGSGLPNAFGTSGQPSGGFYYFSGGGGASNSGPVAPVGSGGTGGGGAGATSGNGTAGTANTGGGGGGGSSTTSPTSPGAGGSGIVVIRYKFQ